MFVVVVFCRFIWRRSLQIVSTNLCSIIFFSSFPLSRIFLTTPIDIWRGKMISREIVPFYFSSQIFFWQPHTQSYWNTFNPPTQLSMRKHIHRHIICIRVLDNLIWQFNFCLSWFLLMPRKKLLTLNVGKSDTKNITLLLLLRFRINPWYSLYTPHVIRTQTHTHTGNCINFLPRQPPNDQSIFGKLNKNTTDFWTF